MNQTTQTHISYKKKKKNTGCNPKKKKKIRSAKSQKT